MTPTEHKQHKNLPSKSIFQKSHCKSYTIQSNSNEKFTARVTARVTT